MKDTLSILGSILLFVIAVLASVALFTYEPETTRYYCPADGAGFVADTIQFPACAPGVIGYDVQLRDGYDEFTTAPVYAES